MHLAPFVAASAIVALLLSTAAEVTNARPLAEHLTAPHVGASPLLYSITPEPSGRANWLATVANSGKITPVGGGVPLTHDLVAQNLATLDSKVGKTLRLFILFLFLPPLFFIYIFV